MNYFKFRKDLRYLLAQIRVVYVEPNGFFTQNPISNYKLNILRKFCVGDKKPDKPKKSEKPAGPDKADKSKEPEKSAAPDKSTKTKKSAAPDKSKEPEKSAVPAEANPKQKSSAEKSEKPQKTPKQPDKPSPKEPTFTDDGNGIEIQLQDDCFKIFGLEVCPPLNVKLSKGQAQTLYYKMQLIRRLEIIAAELYKEKIIRGFCHLYNGQEAVCVGIKGAMRNEDHLITAYRCHGWSYVMGLSPHSILAELTGRKTGCARGKGGSMHMYAPKYYGGNGIVGAQVPLGVGVAHACKYLSSGGVCISCYGDGAANQGQVFEVYNISCLWKLPVIFVCENNHYGMGTKVNRAACNPNYYERAGYIPGIWVNGMRVLAVRSAMAFAIEHALKVGPILLEMDTYRYHGHSMSDPGVSYRSREEVQEVRQKRDPINKFKSLCIDQNLLTEDDFKAIDTTVKDIIGDAAEKAKSDPEVDVKELAADIWAKGPKQIRGKVASKLPHLQITTPANLK